MARLKFSISLENFNPGGRSWMFIFYLWALRVSGGGLPWPFTLAFFGKEKQGKPTKKARGFLFAEPRKSLEKKKFTHKRKKKNKVGDLSRNSQSTRLLRASAPPIQMLYRGRIGKIGKVTYLGSKCQFPWGPTHPKLEKVQGATRLGETGLRASEREICLWEGLSEDLWKPLKNLW